jgi:hypothetical protein
MNLIYDVDDMVNPDGYYFGGVVGKNNILTLEENFTFKLGTVITNKRDEITYNSHNLPTRIDTYLKSTNGDGSESHSYTTYEYIEGH